MKASAVLNTLIGLVGLGLAIATLYWSARVESHIVPVRLVPIHEVSGELIGGLTELCGGGNDNSCRTKFDTLSGLLEFENKGPMPARDISVFVRISGSGCEAKIPGRSSGFQRTASTALVSPNGRFSTGLYVQYSMALEKEQNIEYCVLRRGSLPGVWEATRGKVTAAKYLGRYAPAGFETKTSIDIEGNWNTEETRTFSPSSVCLDNRFGEEKFCTPTIVTKPHKW